MWQGVHQFLCLTIFHQQQQELLTLKYRIKCVLLKKFDATRNTHIKEKEEEAYFSCYFVAFGFLLL